MFNRLTTATFLFVALVALVQFSVPASASINREPVPVTHKNSGPKYELDTVEKQPVTAVAADISAIDNDVSNRKKAQQEGGSDEDAISGGGALFPPAIGHLSIRRLFLVPISASGSDSDDKESDRVSSGDESNSEAGMPTMMRFPMFGIMPPSTPSRHLFGSDMSSRSPFGLSPSDDKDVTSDASSQSVSSSKDNEREAQIPTIMMDPYRLMIDLLQHALDSRVQRPFFGMQPASDLDKHETSNDEKSENPSRDGGSASGEPTKPMTTNETKSEIVEIDGQKFIRKTVIQKHVAPGVVFITKRLIFSPANETSTPNSTEMPSTTTTSIPPTSSTTANSAPTELPASSPAPPSEASVTTSASSLEKEGESPSAVVMPLFSDVRKMQKARSDANDETSTAAPTSTNKPL